MKTLLLAFLAFSTTAAHAKDLDCHSLELRENTGYFAKIRDDKATVIYKSATAGTKLVAHLECANPHDPRVRGVGQIRELLECKDGQHTMSVSHGGMGALDTAHLFRNHDDSEIAELVCEDAK